MKLKTHVNPVESGGIKEISAFQIKTSATAFRILSSGLYSNKIRAIVRELSCNAADSHIAAGTPELPFDLHLPNTIEPHFSVKDYGTGLSHADVMGLYTTYFSSTKSDSNDYTGALGLGSKSPFSYTENFTVISIHDGMQRTYTALIDESGCPNIALMHEMESDAHNGIEVKFAVTDSGDFFNFKREAIQVLRWFAVMPTVNLSEGELAAPILDNVADGIDIVRNAENNTRSVAVQGNVAYPLDENLMKGKRNLTSFQVRAFKSGFVFRFNIGELDIAASREELSYVDYTIEAIYQKLVSIEQYFTNHVMKELQSAKSVWDTGEIVAKLYPNNVYRDVMKGALKTLGIEIHKSTRPSFDIDVDVLKEQNLTLMQFVAKGNGIIGRRTHSKRYPLDKNGEKEYHENMIPSHTIDWTPEVTLYVNDTNYGASDIIKAHMSANNIEHTMVINRIKKTGDTPDSAIKKALKILGNPSKHTTVLLSSMITASPKLAPTKRTVTSTIHLYVVECGRQYSSVLLRGAASSIDITDTAQTYYYIKVDENKEVIVPDGTAMNKDFLRDFISYAATTVLRGFKDNDLPLFGVGPRRIEEVEKAANWVNMWDEFSYYLNNTTSAVSVSNALPSRHDRSPYNSKEFEKAVELLDSSSPFVVHWQACKVRAKEAEKISKTSSRYSTDHIKACVRKYKIGVKEKYQQEIDAALAWYAEIEARYPMIGMCDFGYGLRESATLNLAEYIEIVDLSKKDIK